MKLDTKKALAILDIAPRCGSQSEIARRLKISVATVNRYLKRMDVPLKGKRGRPRKLPVREVRDRALSVSKKRAIRKRLARGESVSSIARRVGTTRYRVVQYHRRYTRWQESRSK